MHHLASFFTIALSLVVSSSALAVPRATPPAGWQASLLEPYDTYHTRYMALSCNTQHNTQFFDQCCHPLLASQSLADRPAQCDPAQDDEDLPFCDEIDGDDDAEPTTTTAVPVHTTKAEPTPTTEAKIAPAAPKAVTSPAAKAVAPSSDATDTTVNTGGIATYFFQNGVAGACGTVHKDTDFIAAIDAARYGNTGEVSSLCGKKVKITNADNGKEVTVTIADACPTCKNSNSIDLSVSAFEQLAPLDQGVANIKWSFA